MADPAPRAEADAAPPFWDAGEWQLSERFLSDGHVIVPAENKLTLSAIRGAAIAAAEDWMQQADRIADPESADATAFLNNLHLRVSASELNDLRLHVIQSLAATPWLRPAYFELAATALQALVGNELAMQKRINLSIQMPDDDSSLLPVHADVWSGDSPFEVVLWVPLVDCFRTKSMFLLPPAANRAAEENFERFAGQSTDALFAAIEPNLTWIDIRYGEVLLFTQNLMHGNRVNQEAGCRWSMNCRVKSLLSPYAGKRLGEFFEPIVIRAATRLGMAHSLPGNFTE